MLIFQVLTVKRINL